MKEEWRQIPGFGGHYEASNLGNIRVKDRIITKRHRTGVLIKQKYKGRDLKPHRADKWGHLAVSLGIDKVDTMIGVHRLVLMAFVGPCPDGMEACHNNGIAWDNRIENLRWDTHYNNNQDRKAHGNYKKGEKHHMAKYTPEQVMAIKTKAVSKREAMQQFGISNSQHHRIMVGKAWSHLGSVEDYSEED